jgi:hypothetical protein
MSSIIRRWARAPRAACETGIATTPHTLLELVKAYRNTNKTKSGAAPERHGLHLGCWGATGQKTGVRTSRSSFC